MFVLCGNPSGLFVGVDAYIDPAEPADFTKVFGKFVPVVAGRCGHRPLHGRCMPPTVSVSTNSQIEKLHPTGWSFFSKISEQPGSCRELGQGVDERDGGETQDRR